LVKKRKTKNCQGKEVEIYVPDGIIAYLTREYGGNVHDCHIELVREGDLGGQSTLGGI
jgi:hypothetical protein